MKALNAHSLKAALSDGLEIALIDVREQSAYGQGHPLLAINIPLSRLELIIRRYVPRLTTRIVILDDDNGMAERAARTLATAGYSDLSTLTGGTQSWQDVGYELFQGNYTLTNAFGLHVSAQYNTPEITAIQLKARMEAGEDLVILDSRPMSEYSATALPGSVDAPGPEQLYHFKDLVSDADTMIAVTCAGKTRGTLACQVFINAGVKNPLFAVEHGTMGWALADFTPERGASRQPGPASASAIEWSAQAGLSLIEDFGIQQITFEQLEHWHRDTDRTLCLIDVRSLGEYEAGHLEGAIWVPGGELTGCTEDHLATRNGRICLVDDNGARASACAMWMMQMGWPEVAVLAGGVGGHNLVSGSEPDVAISNPQVITMVTADDVDTDASIVLDVSSSSSYRQGHVPGALWAVRSALPKLVDQLSSADRCIVTSNDDQLSRWTVADLDALGLDKVSYLAGGTTAWQAAGRSVAQGMECPLIDITDVYVEFSARPDDTDDIIKQSYLSTIAWREQLLDQFHRDGTIHFLTI